MSYAMYGIEAFNEQEADTVCIVVGSKVAEIQQIIEACDDDVRPVVERRLRKAYQPKIGFESTFGFDSARQRQIGPLERQLSEFQRMQPAGSPLDRCTNPLFSGIFGSIL